MLPIKFICFLSASVFSLLAACSKENKSSAPNAEKLPSDFNLIFGEGGGFTGLWQGYTVNAEGAIYSWAGRVPGDNAKPSGALSDKQIKALWQEIQKANFFAQEWNERGNMTAIVRVTANGVTKEWAWVAQSHAASTAKTAPQQLQQYCRDLVQQAVKK